MESIIIKKKKPEIEEEYIKIEHKSGLDIYILPKKMSTANVMLAAKCGSGDNAVKYRSNPTEPWKTAAFPDGIAHFLEHKLFAEEDGVDLSQKLASVGASCNAFTSFDKTAYTFTTGKNLTEAVKILIKGFFSPYFTRQNVDKERAIIAEEIKMYEDDPNDSLFFDMMSATFTHPYLKVGGCGTLSSIKNITPQMLSLYHSIFYRPENSVLCICGQADPGDICNAVDLVIPDFSPLEIKKIKFPENKEVYKQLITKKSNIPNPIINVGVKFVLNYDSPRERMKQLVAINILAEHFFSTGNPFISSFYEQGLVLGEIKYGMDVCVDRGVITLYAESKKAKRVGQMLKKYISTANAQEITDKKLYTLKKVLYSEFLTAFDSTLDGANELLGFACDDFDIFEYPEIINSVDINFVDTIAKNIFLDYNICVAIAMPKQN